ncbi:unnamed protein product, partial [Rotaria sp. Silwood1]
MNYGYGNIACANPYQLSTPYPQRQGRYPPQQSYRNLYASNALQQQSYQNPYGSNPQQLQDLLKISVLTGGYCGYLPYNQPPQQYQNPYDVGIMQIDMDRQVVINDRLRGIAARYEINDTLTQHLNILQQFKIIILCDDSDSMNILVDGTTDTRWDELRSIVRIVIEIGTVFDSNG